VKKDSRDWVRPFIGGFCPFSMSFRPLMEGFRPFNMSFRPFM